MIYPISLTVNNEPYAVSVSPRQTLLDVLRNKLDLHGTHRGCDTGHCGSCTVLLSQSSSTGAPQPQAVASCLLLALEADGCAITTIEGLRKNGRLHPMQQSFIHYGGLQCGYCTPGMIMSAMALYQQNKMPTEREAREAIAGNLCRCTGYTKIVEAMVKAFMFEEAV